MAHASSSSPAASSRYSGTAIALHWLLALGIAGTFGMGLWLDAMPMSPLKFKLFSWHKWAGATILILSVVRLVWRLTHRPPADLPMPRWQAVVAHGTHHLLYLLFFAVPLLGWAYSSAAGRPIVLFGLLPLPDFVPVDKDLADAIKPWHGNLAWAMAILVGMHVAGALKHQLIDKDGLIHRMLPGRG